MTGPSIKIINLCELTNAFSTIPQLFSKKLNERTGEPAGACHHTTGDQSQALLETLLLRLGEMARSQCSEGEEVLDAGQGDISRLLLEAQPL